MKTKFLIPTFLAAAGLAWNALGQDAAAPAPAPPTAPAGTVQTSQGAQQNGTIIGQPNAPAVQPNPGGLHKREEFPNAVIPGELRRTLPGTVVDNGPDTNRPPITNNFTFNTNQFNFPTTNASNAGTAPATRSVAFRDQATTREDQVLLIKLQQAVSTDLRAAATPTTPGGNVITPPVHFVIDNGFVRLIGTVPDDLTKERVLMTVQRIPGVTQVVDQLQVTGTAGADANVTTQNPTGVGVQTTTAGGASMGTLAPTSTRTNPVIGATNLVLPPTSRTGLPPGLQDRELPPGLQNRPLPPGLEMQRTNTGNP